MSKQPPKRRGREFHAALLEEHATSGMTICAFAEAKGVKPATLYAWNRRLHPKNRERASDQIGLLRVDISEAPPQVRQPVPEASRNFTLALDGGHVLGIPAGFDSGELTRLLATLERR